MKANKRRSSKATSPTPSPQSHCVRILYFHYPFIGWWPSTLFHVLAIVSRASANMDKQVSLQQEVGSCEHAARSSMSGSDTRSSSSFPRHSHTGTHSGHTSLCTHQLCMVFPMPQSHANILCLCFFTLSHSAWNMTKTQSSLSLCFLDGEIQIF